MLHALPTAQCRLVIPEFRRVVEVKIRHPWWVAQSQARVFLPSDRGAGRMPALRLFLRFQRRVHGRERNGFAF